MSIETGSAAVHYVAEADAVAFATALFRSAGMPSEDAAIAGGALIRADLRGVNTHGLLRLPIYLERLQRGMVEARPTLEVERIAPSAGSLDGRNGLGFVVGTRAMQGAIDIARETGIGVVSARRSNHFGMASQYVLQALEAGLMAMVFTNSSRAMPPWGGRDPLLGTGPLAIGAPGRNGSTMLLDMSPSVAARGKIRRAARLGAQIPLGYALDADGRETTDPNEALKGVVLPLGGPKGSGLAIMMDIFGGVISGAAFAGGVRDQYSNFSEPQDVGHFFLAMRPDLFIAEEDYYRRMDELAEAVHANRLAHGFSRILLPGEREDVMEAELRSTGIPYDAAELEPLQASAVAAGIAPLTTSAKPLGRASAD